MAGVRARDELSLELWQACAGANLRVPEAGERVYYLPPVHLAQVKGNTENDREMPVIDNPFFKLPPEILCTVVNVQRKVDPQTDEVFALITLQPDPEQEIQVSRHENSQSLPQAANVRSFVKLLTASDTSTHGLTVPKRDALKCLPHLDMSQQTPVQELIAKDIHGYPWPFRHTHRGTPKRHLLTSGWSAFVTSKRLVAGDTVIFLRGKNGDIRVGLRRSLPQKSPPSIVSSHNMLLGVFTSACHAFQTGTRFTFRYHPWASPSDFIVPYDQYIKSLENEYSVGTRLRMQFEGEDLKKRSVGTVVAVDEIDCIRWPGSKWKCLKVQWDATSDTLARPDRVSPWNVEPLELKEHKSNAPLLKRPHKLESSANGLPSAAQDGLFQSSSWHFPPGVLQGQLNESVSAQESKIYKVDDHLKGRCLSDSMSNQCGNPANSGHSVHWVPINISASICDNKGRDGTLSLSYVNPGSFSQEPVASEENYEVEKPAAKTIASSKCRIFGFDLVCSSELPSLQAEMSVLRQSLCSVPTMTSQSGPGNRVSDQSIDIVRKRCWSCSSSSTQNHVKVLKHDTALGRSVDLTHFNGYDELIRELDHMFEFNGKLCDASNGWQVTYQDQYGYMMHIGDLPWQRFTFAAQSLFICRPQEYLESLNSTSVNAFGAQLLPCYHSFSGIRRPASFT